MKLVSKISNILLLLIGCFYVLLGIISFFAPHLGGLMSMILAVPYQLIHATFDWNIGIINKQLFYFLIFIAVLGGMIAIYGADAISRGKIVGYKIWIGLSALALMTSIWNIVWLIYLRSDDLMFNSLIAAVIFFTATYASWHYRDNKN